MLLVGAVTFLLLELKHAYYDEPKENNRNSCCKCSMAGSIPSAFTCSKHHDVITSFFLFATYDDLPILYTVKTLQVPIIVPFIARRSFGHPASARFHELNFVTAHKRDLVGSTMSFTRFSLASMFQARSRQTFVATVARVGR